MGVQALSLVGAAMILAAFALAQHGRWKTADAAYLWVNFVGSSILSLVAWLESQWGFLLLDAVWAAVAAWSLWRQYARRA